jgi:hypothetical protein
MDPRCLAAMTWVNTKAGRGIYLVDNNKVAINRATLMYTVPNLNYLRGILGYFLTSQVRKAVGAATIWGFTERHNFLP